MITDLKPYPSMKNSGLPWCPEVPSHWALMPNRSFLRQRKVLVGDRHPNFSLLSLTKQGVIIRDLTENKGKFSSDMGTSQEVRRGDLVMCLFDVPETPRTIGVSQHDGMITGAYTVFDGCDGEAVHWLERFYIAMDDRKALSPLYSGLRNTIPKPRFLGTKTPVPPPDEQAAIAQYLDHVDRRVRRLVRAKRKLIALLTEQKQAIIHRAVTRGLDPGVPLKDSSVEWLGEIPRHWQAVPLRRVIRCAIDGPHHSPAYVDQGIPFLSARNIKTDRWSLDDAKFISEADYAVFSRRVVPEPGDVLYTKGGTTGIARTVDLDFRFQVWVHIAVLKIHRSKVCPDYLAMALNSPRCHEQAQLLTRGATNQDLGLSRMKGIFLALPPKLEQITIVTHLKQELHDLRTAVHRANREIDLLTEYQTRLIADVVTGKLDVREAASALPKVDPMPTDDGPDDANASPGDLDTIPEEAEA